MAGDFGEFAELHDDLRAVAADVLSRHADWATLVAAGWVGLEVPEKLGGSGAGFAEVALICEELGRAAASTPYLGAAVLAVGVLNTVADGDVRDPLLAGIADGTIRAAAVLGEFTVSAGGRLTGHADFVPDAAGADRLLVPATDATGADVVVVADDLTITAQPLLDETRSVATVTADGIEVGGEAVLRADGTAALHNRGALAVACDSLGLAEAMLAATVDYAKTRTQFGRPIGSFQAVKHACADMQVKNSVARALIREAIDSVAVTAGTDPASDATAAVAMAKSYACSTAVDVVGKAMQLHGGIGYTWESGIHVYLKRATFNRSLFGSPAAHRRKLIHRYQ